ncbi:MAG: hypothetical protein QM756_07785 [Polyangiaceae bacterium]
MNALAAIRSEAGLPAHGLEYSGRPTPVLWVASVGAAPRAVASVLRAICGCSPARALQMVSATSFVVEQPEGTRVHSLSAAHVLQDWRTQLEQAGAVATIRYNDGLD